MNIAKIKQITDRYFIKQGYEPYGSIILNDLYPNEESKYIYRCDLRKGYVHRALYVSFRTKSEIKEKAKLIVESLNKEIEDEINSIMKEFDTFNDLYKIRSFGYIAKGFVDLRYENKIIYFRIYLTGYDGYKTGLGKYHKYYNVKLNKSEIENLRDKMYECFNDFYNSGIEEFIHR